MMAFLLNLIAIASYVLLAFTAYNVSAQVPALETLVPYPVILAAWVFCAGLAGHLGLIYLKLLLRAAPESRGKAARGQEKKRQAPQRREPRLAAPQRPVPTLSEASTPGLDPRVNAPIRAMAAQTQAAIAAGRIDIMLQPIVSLPQRKIHFFECVSRIRAEDGSILEPNQYMPAIKQTGAVASVDNALLFRCARLARETQRRNRDIGFFCNLSVMSLRDGQFVREFVPFLSDHQEVSRYLFLEFRQDDFIQMESREIEHLTRLASLGFRFSLDHVSRLDMNPQFLTRRYVKFVKIPIGLLLQSAADARELRDSFGRRGIDLIADKIEQESDLLQLLDDGIAFGQGFLFGQPRSARENNPAPQATR